MAPSINIQTFFIFVDKGENFISPNHQCVSIAMIIIGITGTLGAGKGTVVNYLIKEKGFTHYSVRSYLAAIITSNHQKVNRDSLTHTANALRQKHGPAYIIEELYRLANKKGKDCVIESIRTPGEIKSLRKQKNFILLAIDADVNSRFERIKIRNSETDQIDFDTFKNNEQREMVSSDPTKQNLSACIEAADYVILNNGDKQELEQKTEDILQRIAKELSPKKHSTPKT